MPKSHLDMLQHDNAPAVWQHCGRHVQDEEDEVHYVHTASKGL